jgi:signal transduction histidine kinase
VASRSWMHLPRRTVRLRLTALYGALFLVSGAGLLAITYGLVASQPRAVFFQVAGTAKGTVRLVPGPAVRVRLPGGPFSKAATALARHALSQVPVPGAPPRPLLPAGLQFVGFQATLPTPGELQRLLIESGIALAIMAIVSIGLGWLVAGRVLRPLRTMTSAARHISEESLNERLAVRGPADELKDLGDTIDGLLGRLETSFEAQRRFVANASHELRTPLAMMRTSLDVAVGKPAPVPPEVAVLAGKLEEGLDQADKLLEGLLLLARAQQGAVGELTEVSLSDLVSGALDANQARIAQMGLAIDDETDDAKVIGNETLLERMVANVVDNAVRHNLAGGRVHIFNDSSGDNTRLVVDSAGTLLDEQQARQLGEPFHKLGTERTANGEGAGLGLSIVRAIAYAHGGMLELHARPEGGLRVVIELTTAPVRA